MRLGRLLLASAKIGVRSQHPVRCEHRWNRRRRCSDGALGRNRHRSRQFL